MSDPCVFNGGSFVIGVLFTIAVQSVTGLLLDGVDAILAWRRKKRGHQP